jgi:hypothetical protein
MHLSFSFDVKVLDNISKLLGFDRDFYDYYFFYHDIKIDIEDFYNLSPSNYIYFFLFAKIFALIADPKYPRNFF